MKKLLFVLAIICVFSCEPMEPDCLWCTTVFVSPETGVVIGEGYACGDDLDIIQERQYYQVDSITGDVRLTVTYCGDKISTEMFFSKPLDTCVTCTIHVYSPSKLMPDRYSTKELCTDEEKAKYPVGVHGSSACDDCRVQIGCI